MKWVNRANGKSIERAYKFIPSTILAVADKLHFEDEVIEEHYCYLLADRYIDYKMALTVIVESVNDDFEFIIFLK